MKGDYFSSVGSINRLVFLQRTLVFIVLSLILSFLALYFFTHWHHGVHMPLGYFFSLVFILISSFAFLMQLIKRLNNIGKPPFYTLLLLIPVVNVLFLVYAFLAPANNN